MQLKCVHGSWSVCMHDGVCACIMGVCAWIMKWVRLQGTDVHGQWWKFCWARFIVITMNFAGCKIYPSHTLKLSVENNYVCTHIYTHTYTYIHIHTHIYTQVQTHTHRCYTICTCAVPSRWTRSESEIGSLHSNRCWFFERAGIHLHAHVKCVHQRTDCVDTSTDCVCLTHPHKEGVYMHTFGTSSVYAHTRNCVNVCMELFFFVHTELLLPKKPCTPS